MLLSGVMAVVLQGRGVLTLHASAVRVGGAAVVFAGASGTGKSTLAAYLASCGHVVQSDGFVAIVDTRATPMVLAGPATQKLWPDAAEWLGLDPMHPRLAPATKKFLIAAPHTLARDPVPLARIYVLDSTFTESSGRTHGSRRLTDLAAHLFMPHYVWGKAGDQAAKLLELARSTTVQRLARADGSLETSLPMMGKEVLDGAFACLIRAGAVGSRTMSDQNPLNPPKPESAVGDPARARAVDAADAGEPGGERDHGAPRYRHDDGGSAPHRIRRLIRTPARATRRRERDRVRCRSAAGQCILAEILRLTRPRGSAHLTSRQP